MSLRVIHAGLGGWGTNWEELPIPRVTDVERVAIVEPFEPGLRKAQAAFDLPDSMCFTSLDDAIASVDADAVILTTPMETHVPSALTALGAGKHVLVEKPFAGTLAEARSAVEFAEERGLILQVSQNYRFYPGARTAARMVREQVLGPVGTVSIDFRQHANNRPIDSNPHYSFTHPLLMDMAIHHFDLARMILGTEPVAVYARTTDPPWSNFRDEASATIVITMSNDVVISYRGNWISSGEPTLWSGDWHIDCKDGEIAWTGRENDTTEYDRLQLRPLGGASRNARLDPVKLHGRAGGLQAFVDAIRTGVEPETSGRRNLGSVALMQAAVQSAETGVVVEIPAV